MKRRSFLAALPFIPLAVKAAVTQPSPALPTWFVAFDPGWSEKYQHGNASLMHCTTTERVDIMTDRATADAINASVKRYYRKAYGIGA